jgi:hypothetical protein
MGCSSRKEKRMEVPVAGVAGEPYLFADADSIVYLSWVETIDSINYLKYSTLAGDSWSAPITISSGANWFVNWADYPVVAVRGNNFAATYLEKSGDATFSYDIKLTTSRDGLHWSTPITLHDDGKQAEHGFVTIVPYDDNFFIAWLDGRNTVMEGMEHHEGHHGQMSLRAAVVDADGKKLNEWELDNRVCDCCQTTAAITPAGPVVVYRDRSRDEVRDMSIVRLVDGQWTDPQPVFEDEWKIDGCPVNGPRMAAIGERVGVVWFTGSDGSQVKLAFSEDNGATFSPPTRFDGGHPVGRVDVALGNEGHAYITWIEDEEIRWMPTYESSGNFAVVAKSSSARAAGFPQMAMQHGHGFVFAWTDVETKKIMTALWQNVR